MSKNIKDYIHYYIGQKALLAKKCEPEKKVIGEIVEVSNHHSNHGRWILANCGDVVTLMNCGTWETFGTNMPHFFLGEDIIQPLLRKLEDMTEEEVRASIKLMEGHLSNHPIHRRVKNAGTADQFSQWYYVHNNEEHIIMNLSGGENGFQIYNNGNHYYRCYMKLFDHLLREGFDIWGLIHAGLAIDAKTITQ